MRGGGGSGNNFVGLGSTSMSRTSVPPDLQLSYRR
jgi:hypothetical protein